MKSFNLARQTENIRRELTDVMKDVKDPRVAKAMISVVRVELTSDFSYAKIYVSSVLGAEKTKDAVVGFKSAAKFVRQELSSRVKMKRLPELIFVPDDSAQYSDEINRKLKSISEGGS